jgi:hypothetical protein
MNFATISDRRRVSFVDRIFFSICTVSDNFGKIENARFRVAFHITNPSPDR